MAVTALEIKSCSPFAPGQTFGDVGPYQQLDATVHFAVDPDHPRNAGITDLQRAPRDAQGLVRCSADVRVPGSPRTMLEEPHVPVLAELLNACFRWGVACDAKNAHTRSGQIAESGACSIAGHPVSARVVVTTSASRSAPRLPSHPNADGTVREAVLGQGGV